MSGNDYAEFLPLDPNITTNSVEFPSAFQSVVGSGGSPATDFDLLTPNMFKVTRQANGQPLSEVLDNQTPEVFTYNLTTEVAATVAATTYRMRGYYVGGSTYEFWITSDPNAANPSGNPLIGRMIDSIISNT